MEFVTDREIYEKVICGLVPTAKQFVWLATADLKDMYVDKNRKRVPFLEVLSDLTAKNVEVRLLHSKEPGPNFRRDFDRYPNLAKGIEQILCPRVHFKCVIVDGKSAYSGSANITGAGIGAKSVNKRNFESGFITRDEKIIALIMEQFDNVWRGSHCRPCGRKEFCAEHSEIVK
jgi:phosphatidylserine/phosphatidylglycerophosphate/cardiolipin synthase-like enzyme